MASYELEPELPKQPTIVAGDAALRAKDLLLLGDLAESGRRRKLYLDISGEQVVAIFGKRGTGKSYTMGVMLEGLASAPGNGELASKKTPRAALVLDIMDIFWTSTIPLKDGGPAELSKQYQIMKGSGYTSAPLNVDVWIPRGYENPSIDPPNARSLVISASDMELDDWGALFNIDIFTEPRGMLIHEVIHAVKDTGYTDDQGNFVLGKPDYSISDLLHCCEHNPSLAANYQDVTIRSVRQRMMTYSTMPLFQGTSTPLNDLLKSFYVSVLMLARLSESLKNVLVSVLCRRIMRNRRDASFAQKRLDLQSDISTKDRTQLEEVIASSIPRTWLMMDEAHVLASTDSPAVAQQALIQFAKEGRNYGLSLCLATQQPSAIDTKLMSQVETMITHQLTAPRDAQVAQDMIRSPPPTSIKLNGQEINTQNLIRQLSPGQVVFSSGNAPQLPRYCILNVRPRITAHGGYEA